ncbi:hypothetical protein ACLKMH_18590 [Psychromonas sp. KJ10-10]|uniref:hypothetical protein n=1 Tax=Psychromonas sp. KJ10-10 TaxID=3391823 RepID=UPI0039B3F732
MDITNNNNNIDDDDELNQPLAYEKVVTLFGYLILGIAVSLSVFQIWQGVSSTISATYFRPIHLCWVLVLIFLHYPLY